VELAAQKQKDKHEQVMKATAKKAQEHKVKTERTTKNGKKKSEEAKDKQENKEKKETKVKYDQQKKSEQAKKEAKTKKKMRKRAEEQSLKNEKQIKQDEANAMKKKMKESKAKEVLSKADVKVENAKAKALEQGNKSEQKLKAQLKIAEEQKIKNDTKRIIKDGKKKAQELTEKSERKAKEQVNEAQHKAVSKPSPSPSCSDQLKTCQHYAQRCKMAKKLKIKQKLNGKVVASGLLSKLCAKTCHLCKSTPKASVSSCKDKPRPKHAKPCSWYKKNKVCVFAPTSRRRGWGGDANDNCKRTCGLCKAGALATKPAAPKPAPSSSCADGKPQYQSCAYYSKRYCTIAKTSRRRTFGGDAKDNCKKTCKLCASEYSKESPLSMWNTPSENLVREIVEDA